MQKGSPVPSPSAAPPEPRTYPFSAVVGSDDMALALVLTTVSPEVGGVLVRGEKGTAKSTMVRALARGAAAARGRRGLPVLLRPGRPRPALPRRPAPRRHRVDDAGPPGWSSCRSGATEDRVIGSLDLQQALGAGRVGYEPGLLAAAHRGLLYVDEVNLLHDHLVDLLLDAAAMGRSTVEREGVSVAHASRMVLIGTMNPEEGELRPAAAGPLRADGRGRRPARPGPARRGRPPADGLRPRPRRLRRPLRRRRGRAAPAGSVGPRGPCCRRWSCATTQLLLIAEVCAAFEVDGMRADIVTARAAVAHAAWHGRTTVTRADIRAAARLALPHRRRRNPFDAPGLDEELLDRLLGEDEPEPEPPQPDDPQPGPDDEGGEPADGSADPAEGTDTGSTGDPRRAPGRALTPGRRTASRAPRRPSPSPSPSPSRRATRTARPPPSCPPARQRRAPPTGPGSSPPPASARARPGVAAGPSPGPAAASAPPPVPSPAAGCTCPRPSGRPRRSRPPAAAPAPTCSGCAARTCAPRSPRAGSPTSCCSSSTPPARWPPAAGWRPSRPPPSRCCWTPTSAATRSAW